VNNPLIYKDPSGESVRDVFVGFVDSIDYNVLNGFANAMADGTYTPDNEAHYYAGRAAGDAAVIVVGTVETSAGVATVVGSVGGGALITGASGGVATVGGVVVVVEGVAAGSAMAGHGVAIMSSGIGNFGENVERAQAATERQNSRTAGDIIKNEKKGSINRQFPDQWRNSTLGEIEKAAKKGDKSAQTAKKLLSDKDFNKTSNSTRSKK
jgi:hypothetical protein